MEVLGQGFDSDVFAGFNVKRVETLLSDYHVVLFEQISRASEELRHGNTKAACNREQIFRSWSRRTIFVGGKSFRANLSPLSEPRERNLLCLAS